MLTEVPITRIHFLLVRELWKIKNVMLIGVLSIQITGETVGEVKAVSGMHQRKAEMVRHADAFIALPG